MEKEQFFESVQNLTQVLYTFFIKKWNFLFFDRIYKNDMLPPKWQVFIISLVYLEGSISISRQLL